MSAARLERSGSRTDGRTRRSSEGDAAAGRPGPRRDTLKRLNALGCRFPCSQAAEPPAIEETLLDAARELPDDALYWGLASWLKVHGGLVDVARLLRLRAQGEEAGRPAPWLSALAAQAVDLGHPAWGALVRPEPGVHALSGWTPEQPRSPALAAAGFGVPRDPLKLRPGRIAPPAELAGCHPAYRERLALLGEGRR
jgi:hypothetical protein